MQLPDIQETFLTIFYSVNAYNIEHFVVNAIHYHKNDIIFCLFKSASRFFCKIRVQVTIMLSLKSQNIYEMKHQNGSFLHHLIRHARLNPIAFSMRDLSSKSSNRIEGLRINKHLGPNISISSPFLRAEQVNSTLQNNRIKVLIDALTAPSHYAGHKNDLIMMLKNK